MGKRKSTSGIVGIWPSLLLSDAHGLIWFELRCGRASLKGAITREVALYAYTWLNAYFTRKEAEIVAIREKR